MKKIILLYLIILLPDFVYAQCSDAGACQLNHFMSSNEQDFDIPGVSAFAFRQ